MMNGRVGQGRVNDARAAGIAVGRLSGNIIQKN